MRYNEKRLDYQLIFQSLYQAVKWRLLPRNPVKDVELPRQKRKEVKVLTASRTRHETPPGITAPKRGLPVERQPS